MKLWEAIVFGIIQGATEFLPVSSSGHLFLAQAFMESAADFGFFVWLHVGTLFAVCVFYRKTIFALLKNPRDKRLLCLILSSVPTFVIAAAFKFFMPENLGKYLLPTGFLGTFVLLLLNKPAPQRKNLAAMSVRDALIVGTVQGLAVIPGLSRSGSTISALGFMGYGREESGEYSFLLSVPVIIGGAAADIFELISSGKPFFSGENSLDLLNKALGVAIAAVVGIFALNIVEKFLKTGNFRKFAWYLPVPLLISILLL